jgi:6-phosphofructokinase 2
MAAPAPGEIATFTASPAIDLSCVVERIVPFSKLRCSEARSDPGGGGINVARVLRRLGVASTAVFPAGGAKGQMLQVLLKQEDIAAVFVPVGQDTRQDFTVTERQSGAQYRFVFPGARLTGAETTSLLQALQEIEPVPQYIVAGGSLPEGTRLTLFADIARIATAQGAKLVVDTSGAALVAALAEPVYLIKPNLHEFQELVQSPLDTLEEQLQAARRVLHETNLQMITLTLGAEGALLVTAENAWRGIAPKIHPVSSVGAGDSFLGGLVWQLSRGASNQDALRFAIAAGSAALVSPGTELCRPPDIEKLLPRVQVTQL